MHSFLATKLGSFGSGFRPKVIGLIPSVAWGGTIPGIHSIISHRAGLAPFPAILWRLPLAFINRADGSVGIPNALSCKWYRLEDRVRKVSGKRVSVLTSEVRVVTFITYIPTFKDCMAVQCLTGVGGHWSFLGGWLNKVRQMPILAQVHWPKIAALFSLPSLNQGFWPILLSGPLWGNLITWSLRCRCGPCAGHCESLQIGGVNCTSSRCEWIAAYLSLTDTGCLHQQGWWICGHTQCIIL